MIPIKYLYSLSLAPMNHKILFGVRQAVMRILLSVNLCLLCTNNIFGTKWSTHKRQLKLTSLKPMKKKPSRCGSNNDDPQNYTRYGVFCEWYFEANYPPIKRMNILSQKKVLYKSNHQLDWGRNHPSNELEHQIKFNVG